MTVTNGFTAETLEQEAPAIQKPKTAPKPIQKPATPKKPNLPEPSKNEVELIENDIPAIENGIDITEIEWLELSIPRAQREEDPLQIMVYYKTDEKGSKHGRITFSYTLTKKFGSDKKFKFGALKGKILFQVTDKEGLPAKVSTKPYSKLCILNRSISEVICDRYGVEQSKNSTYFKLKELGNDFYLIDEIIK